MSTRPLHGDGDSAVPAVERAFTEDVNGANNICSKGVHGVYAKVQAATVKYLRPIGVAPPTQAKSLA